MESHKRTGFMKSKLVKPFYRAAKPHENQVKLAPSSDSYVGYYVVGHGYAIPSPDKASSSQTNSFCGCDGYVHGPNGGGGDENVDMKASSYISYVKQRIKLERVELERVDYD
ncbi:hypothetical protein Acr_29g0002780 [Actinidia rufa]|uniref:Uncharacterized protein n=1 Tax=Actinidia rufa TaxID=165716 RepID=A0A7J0HDD9_9ERIC|nr:hypothetical protein Acr_29g0002780 [Actinidia rufa]